MLKKEDYIVIKTMKKQGAYNKDIAAEIGVSTKTVQRALKRGSAPKGKRKKRGSKLDPFKPLVDELLKQGIWNANVIQKELEAAGYEGKETILREYIQPKRPSRKSRATVRFETKPGQQLQSDWGEIETEIGGERVKVDFIVNVLGYSRRFHFWCTDSQDAEHTYEGIIRSFEYFAGVPEQVLVDNQKSAVYQPKTAGRAAVFNSRFLDLADHYQFIPDACRPYRARTKGKCERMVGYIKENFFVRYQSFESWEHLNQLAEQWLKEVADQRKNSTVNEVVSERFKVEHPHLHRLPSKRYDTAYLEYRQASWDGYIEVRGNRYSVPAGVVGEQVMIRIGLDRTLRIYANDQLIASHLLQSRTDGWVTVRSHHSDLWSQALQVQQRDLAVYAELASLSGVASSNEVVQ